ncbi:MAG: hypothetical protein DRO67_03110 [Candidatus Asgardarchaeum californiense]|nr:MAG: hypothetical protein DRO67_03110 [Candidatus Asgardarchaeum californiense]
MSQSQNSTEIKKLVFVLKLSVFMVLFISIIIPLILIGFAAYLKAYLNLIPPSEEIPFFYFALLIIAILSVAYSALTAFNILFKNVNPRVRIILMFDGAVTPSIIMLLNSLMIWIGLYGAGGMAILFIVAMIGIYLFMLATT